MNKNVHKALFSMVALVLFILVLAPKTAIATLNNATIALDELTANETFPDWTYNSSTKIVTINNGANVTINGVVNDGRRIVVAASANVTIILNGVSLNCSGVGESPLDLQNGAIAQLILNAGTVNTLMAGSGHSGIEVAADRTLTIGGTGKLISTGGTGLNGGGGSAGIGSPGTASSSSGNLASGGTIIINSGIVTATGGTGIGEGGGGAGIGGGGGYGNGGDGGTIAINNGTIIANGGAGSNSGGGGASIGGGGAGGGTTGHYILSAGGAGGSITICSGKVTASGGTGGTAGGTLIGGAGGGAGIGGGGGGAVVGGRSGTITISGGTIAATGGISNATTGSSGAGIGGGGGGNYGGPGDMITISGGIVTGIGGSVKAKGGGAGIGGGGGSVSAYDSSDGGTIIISGGTVTGIGSDTGTAAGIGGGGIFGGTQGATATGSVTMPYYIYWTNIIPSNPGGPGISVPGGIVYIHNNANRYVRITPDQSHSLPNRPPSHLPKTGDGFPIRAMVILLVTILVSLCWLGVRTRLIRERKTKA